MKYKLVVLGCLVLLAGSATALVVRDRWSRITIKDPNVITLAESSAPNVVSLAVGEGGEIVAAGALDLEMIGWAVTVGPDGKIKWRTTLTASNTSRASFPQYASVVPLSSGNSALCGKFSSTDGASRGIVDFIDRKGKMTHENRIQPQLMTPVPFAEVKTCVRVPGGLVAVGRVSVANAAKASSFEQLWWVTSWNENGMLRWDRTFSSSLADLSEIGVVQPEPDGTVILSAWSGAQSEVVALDKDGKIAFHEVWPRAYKLIRSIRPSTSHLGISTADRARAPEIIQFDSHLKVTGRTASPDGLRFGISQAVTLDDQHIFLFGDRVTASGSAREAAIKIVTRDFRRVSTIDLPTIDKANAISAVTYDAVAKKFVVAFSFIESGRLKTDIVSFDDPVHK